VRLNTAVDARAVSADHVALPLWPGGRPSLELARTRQTGIERGERIADERLIREFLGEPQDVFRSSSIYVDIREQCRIGRFRAERLDAGGQVSQLPLD